MKKLSLSMTTALFLSISHPITLKADWIDTSKEYANKVNFWKNEKNEYGFKHIYPKAFYKKSYFAPTAITAAVVSAVAVSYFTAGTGAPAAAAGVSSLASSIAGGGAGSYLAGLYAVGSWFGGGMVLGGAILNGVVLGSMAGGTLTLANMTMLQKIEASALVTAMGMDGIVYFKNPETGINEYRVRLEIPKDLGSEEVRQIVDNIYEANEAIIDAVEDGDTIKQKAMSESIKLYTKSAIELLEKKLETNEFNQEDIIVLSVIAWRNGNFDIFEKAISKTDTFKAENKGFLHYLYALKSLKINNTEQAIIDLDKSLNENKYALEPVILKINILSNTNFLKNEVEIDKLIQYATENFDSDKYATFLNLTSLYYRAGTIYFSNKEFSRAKNYYQKSLDNLGLLQKNFFGKQLKHTIELAIANSMYKEGEEIKADKIYYGIINDINEEDDIAEIKKIKESYLGSNIKKK